MTNRRGDVAARGDVTIRLTLTAEAAAGLKRFSDKVTHEVAQSVLYGHVQEAIRGEQAGAILGGFGALARALEEAGVRSWPWIETGKP